MRLKHKTREKKTDALTRLRTAHPDDVPEIAAAAPKEALKEAAGWASRVLPGSSVRRRAIEAEISKRKGGRA